MSGAGPQRVETRRGTFRPVVIGVLGGLVVIAIFAAGWALRGPETGTLAASPTTVLAGGASSTSASTTTRTVEPYTGPALQITPEEFKTRWNSLAEQEVSLLTITEFSTDEEETRELESIGASVSWFSYLWDNIELRGQVIEGDGRIYNLIVQGGVRCKFEETGTTLTEVCEGSFEDTSVEFQRFTDLQRFLVAVVHPGIDWESVWSNWLVSELGQTDSIEVVDETGFPPVINGVTHMALYGSDGYIIHVSPDDP